MFTVPVTELLQSPDDRAQQLAASLKSPTSLGLGGAKIRWFGAKERGADLDSAAGRHSS